MVRGVESIKKFFSFLWYRYFKASTTNFIIFLLVLVFGLLSILMVYRYWDSIMLAIPGVVSHDEYNELTDQKNEYINQNAGLLSENAGLEVELADLSDNEYSQRADIYNEIIINLQEVIENIGAMIAYGEQFVDMQLPVYVTRYVELSQELDELRLQASQKSLLISQARKDQNDLNWKRDSFDLCLNEVGWNGDDSTINSEILVCIDKIDIAIEYVGSLEANYEVSLEDLHTYFATLKEQWTASADYYSALSESNYTKANEYDEVFAEKRREIEESDLEEILVNFSTLVVLPASDEFAEISEQVASKQNEVDIWYEENIEK